MTSLPQWQLESGRDRRFRAGHPWVYSNELQGSPKGVEPGQLVELRDSSGKFLARGFGNPHSLIAFRVLTRDAKLAAPDAEVALTEKLLAARALRHAVGFRDDVSYRICFGEADGIPGLVIDHYALARGGRVIVLQAHSAGADRLTPHAVSALRSIYADAKGALTFVLRNDVGVRKLEGLTVDPSRLLEGSALSGGDLRDIEIRVRAAGAPASAEPLTFSTDLFEGQKTGFFLDQWANIDLAIARLLPAFQDKSELRILDLCCYVGQWGSQLSRAFTQAGKRVHVTAFDASESALKFATTNIKRAGATSVAALKGDVFEDLAKIGEQFDIVVCDPPALIKGRKDIPQGKHAYLQLNTAAIKLLAPRGAIISCSCSGLLEDEDFAFAISKASARNQRSIAWIAQGGPSPDHPVRLEFPEGRYLKAWIGI